MNLLCPQCHKTIAIADQYAGQIMKCPLCSGTFTAPVMAPAAAPSASAGFATVAEAPTFTGGDRNTSHAAHAGASTRLADEGYSRTATIWISPRAVPWIGPVALLLVFVFSFFPWIWVFDKTTLQSGAFRAWGLAFSQPVNSLSLLYILVIAVAVPLGLVTLILPRLSIPLPDMLQQILPYRSAILLALVTMSLVFLVLQLLFGFNQETAYPDALPIYSARTNWLRTSVLFHFLALAGYALECWLAFRKTLPWPRIEFHW
jgi:hypothetical protein